MEYYATPRKIDFLIAGVAAVVGCCVLTSSLMWAIFLFAGSGYWVYRQVNPVRRTLIVTNKTLSGQNGMFRWKDISNLEYRSEGENGPTGLFVRTGRWSTELLLDEVSRDQTIEIITAIYTRFPFVEMNEAEESSGPLFKSELISLNLAGLVTPHSPTRDKS